LSDEQPNGFGDRGTGNAVSLVGCVDHQSTDPAACVVVDSSHQKALHFVLNLDRERMPGVAVGARTQVVGDVGDPTPLVRGASIGRTVVG